MDLFACLTPPPAAPKQSCRFLRLLPQTFDLSFLCIRSLVIIVIKIEQLAVLVRRLEEFVLRAAVVGDLALQVLFHETSLLAPAQMSQFSQLLSMFFLLFRCHLYCRLVHGWTLIYQIIFIFIFNQ